MDRIWQWAWDRHGPRYSWAFYAIAFSVMLPIYLVSSLLIVAYEESVHYVEAAAITVVGVLVQAYVNVLPGTGQKRFSERWAAGHEVDRAKALKATYTHSRKAVARAVLFSVVWIALISIGVGAIAGVTGLRLIQYGILGAVIGVAVNLSGTHNFTEAAFRPVRAALSGGTDIGDSLPRSRPTFAMWTNLFLLSVVFLFAVAGAMLAAVLNVAGHGPAIALVIGFALTLGMAVPISVVASLSPSLQPIRDLTAGTQRVAAGDYSQRLPVVQDDDLGALLSLIHI